MRTATLITGLKTCQVRCDRFARYHEVVGLQPLIASDGEMLLADLKTTVTERIVPITQFCRPGKPNLYIAYSQEVEDLLGVPIRVLLQEKDAAYAALNRLENMTVWEHAKLAWKLLWSKP